MHVTLVCLQRAGGLWETNNQLGVVLSGTRYVDGADDTLRARTLENLNAHARPVRTRPAFWEGSGNEAK